MELQRNTPQNEFDLSTEFFEGIPSGDHESFCWDVSRQTFIEVTGRAPDDHDRSVFNEGMFRLYPDQLIPDQARGKSCRFAFGVEPPADDSSQSDSNQTPETE